MLQNIFNIIGIACFAYILVYKVVVPLKQLFKVNTPIKPFDCPLCLSWWIGLGWFVPDLHLTGVLYAAIAAVLSGVIERRA